MRRALCLSLFSLVLLAGCPGQKTPSGPPPNDTPATDAIKDKNYSGLAACKGGSSSVDLEKAVQIGDDFNESCHEMVVCGGLNASMSTAIISILINAAAGSSSDPKGFTFDGKGNWHSEQMDVQFLLGFDTSFGKKGDLIAFNPFDLGNYFTGSKLTATASVDLSGDVKTSLDIAFTGVGPGFELLGIDATSSPIKVDSDKVAEAIGKVLIRSQIHIDDVHAHSHFLYELSTDPAPLSQVSDGQQVMHLLSITGTNDDQNQTLTINRFDINYQQIGAGYLDGAIGFDVAGGAFPYQVLFGYPRRTAPDVLLGCPGDTLVAPKAPDTGAAGGKG